MCVSCGCGKADDDHGDSRNITKANLNEAAEAANISVEEATRNIQQAAGTGTQAG